MSFLRVIFEKLKKAFKVILEIVECIQAVRCDQIDMTRRAGYFLSKSNTGALSASWPKRGVSGNRYFLTFSARV